MKQICLIFLTAALFLYVPIFGQQQSSGHKHKTGNTTNRFAVFMNTLSLLEPQQAAIGAGVNYKLHKRWDISLEANYLFDGFWQGGDDYNSQGYRGIMTVKRFSKSRIFFYGLDIRLKHYAFADRKNFINTTVPDTLYNFRHDASNTLFGGAAIVGVRLPISKNKKWAFEINTGVGDKHRTVNRKNIPVGYTYYPERYSKHYNFIDSQDITSDDNVYFPSAIRIMYFF